MQRHDPLSAIAGPVAEPPPAPTPTAPKRKRKTTPTLLDEVAAVADGTLSFLFAGANATDADTAQALDRVAAIRNDFTEFCKQNQHYANWRQAWSGFIQLFQTPTPAPLAEPEPKPVTNIVPVNFTNVAFNHPVQPANSWQDEWLSDLVTT